MGGSGVQGEPQQFGGWQLGEQLGAGGMGAVYAATRGDQVAAVKLVHPGLASDPDFRLRFKREVDIARRVMGPHVAAVIDADPGSLTPWLATELVPGVTLAQEVARNGRLESSRLRDTALGMARAVAALHADGVIHRDIKPSNVLLSPRGPVLLDFGIAAAADLTSMTSTGLRLGSAGWMSPEQVEGRLVTPKTDVFSWGLTVAFAASGSNPYGTGAPEALLYRIVHDAPNLDAVPDLWHSIVRAALSPRPEDRPTADELVVAVKDPQSQASIFPTVHQAPPTRVRPPDPERTSSLTTALPFAATDMTGPRKRGPLFLAATVMALVALLGTGIWWVQMREPTPSSMGDETHRGVDALPLDGADEASPDADDATQQVSEPSEDGASESRPSDSDVPTLRRTVDVGSEKHLRQVGRFFARHVQEEVRLDLEWLRNDGNLNGHEDGGLEATLACAPICPMPVVIAGVLIYADLTDATDDVTFAGVGNEWRITGTFFVQSTTIENGGFYQVAMRPSGGSAATLEADRSNAPDMSQGDCETVEAQYLPYPGRPLSREDGADFPFEVQTIQDLLNVQSSFVDGLECVREDGYFGPETERAVRAYQRAAGSPPDGIVGEETWSGLMLYFE